MQRLSFIARFRWFIGGLFVLGGLFFFHFVSPILAGTLLDWRSLSSQLPNTLATPLSLSAGNGTNWLVSNGSSLFSVRDDLVTNLTDRMQSTGRLKGMGTDQNRYLLAFSNANQTQPVLRLTDGLTWEDVPNSSVSLHTQIDRITGSAGSWLIQSSEPNTAYYPGSWELVRWSASQIATALPLPESVSRYNAGCFTFPGGNKVCAGKTTPVYVNGELYLFGGGAESRDSLDRITQTSTAVAWHWDGQRFIATPLLPSTKFVSGVWAGQNQVLIATSHAVTNPFAADDFWLFDGTTMTSLHDQALAAGLLSIDARTISAAQNAQGWMLLAGKNVLRLENGILSVAGTTRDLYETIAGSATDRFLVTGSQSAFDQATAFSPLQTAIATIGSASYSTHDANQLFRLATAQETDQLATIHVATAPYATDLKDGGWFTYETSATDPDGVQQVDVLVQGARVMTCANTCRYTQQYWLNGADRRVIPFVTRVTDTQGHVTESQPTFLTLTATSSQTTVTPPTTVPDIGTLPAGLSWKTTSAGPLEYAAWTQNDQGSNTWRSENTLRFRVMGRERTNGVEAIVLWVNGTAVKTCSLTGAQKKPGVLVSCEISLLGTQYPAGAEVFMNAQFIRTGNPKKNWRPVPFDLWTDGIRITRSASQEAPCAKTQPSLPAPIGSSAPTQQLIMSPNASMIAPGTRVTFTGIASNPTARIQHLEFYRDQELYRTCSFASLEHTARCELVLESSETWAVNSVPFSLKVVDENGHATWANIVYLTITPPTNNPTQNTLPLSQGALIGEGWFTPNTPELTDGHIVHYVASAWGPLPLKTIDLFQDGVLVQHCGFVDGPGGRTCDVTAQANDYPHGQILTFSARVEDVAGHQLWVPARTLTVRREWNSLTSAQPWIKITAQKDTINGRATLLAEGWSNNTDKLEIWFNNNLVQTCTNVNACQATVYPSTSQSYQSFSAVLIQKSGQEVWTGQQGLQFP